MLELIASIENTNNTTTTQTVRTQTTSSPIWFIILCFLISFLCILGNGCVIYLVKTRASLQGTSNSFIVSLAVADLLVGFFVFPSKLASELLLGNIQLQRVFSELLMYWSVYNLCGMTIERFVFIVLPMKHHIYMSKQRSVILIVLCWIIPLINFGLHFTWLYSKSEETKKFWLKNFTAIETITMVGVPSLVLVVLYSKIFTVAQRHRKITANQIGMVSYNKPSSPTSPGPSDSKPNEQQYQGVVSNSKETEIEMVSSKPTSPMSCCSKSITNENQEVFPKSLVHEPCGSICLDNKYDGGLYMEKHIKSTCGNHSNDNGASRNISDGDRTPGNTTNTAKCLVNEQLSSEDERLANLTKTTQTKCLNLSNALHENRKDFETNQEPDESLNKLKAKCQENCFRHKSVDKVGQTGNVKVGNDTNEIGAETVDGFLNSQSKRIYDLNATFQSSFTVINDPQNEVKNVRKIDQTSFSVSNNYKIGSERAAEQKLPSQSNNDSIQNQLNEVNIAENGVKKIRKKPIIEAESAMSSEEAVRYLAFYSAIQSSTKTNKQSLKKRLGQVIQKKRRTGASVIGSVIATFLICWGVALYASICYYFELCVVSPNMSQIQWVLLLLNSAVNPIVYAMLKTDLRKEFANVIRCK